MKRKPIVENAPREPYKVGYARVSTEDQNLDLQIDALRRAGVHEDSIHVEKISATARKRQMLDNAIKELRPGDVLVVWRLDRLARNMRELYDRLDKIKEAGAGFKSLTEHFDFTTAVGQLMLGIIGVMAQFERQLTIERTKAGMAAAKERGAKFGAETKVTKDVKAKMAALLKEHKVVEVKVKDPKHPGKRKTISRNRPAHTIEQIAAKLGLSVGSVYGAFRIERLKSGGRKIVSKK